MAAVDLRTDRRETIAREIPGCRAVERIAALLDARSVDALIVATPPETHFHLAKQGLEEGVALLVEKPLAASVAEALELDCLSRTTATPLMVGFNRRWWSPAVRLRDELRGHPGPARADLRFVTDAAEWDAVDGAPDLIDDLATHQVDLLRFVFGREILSVSANRGGPREITMEIRLRDDTTAYCCVAHHGQSQESVRVTAGAGAWWIHSRSDRVAPAGGTLRTALDSTGRAWRRLTGHRSAMRCSFEEELRAFVQAVRTRSMPNPGASDGVIAARAVAAVRTSLEQAGEAVML